MRPPRVNRPRPRGSGLDDAEQAEQVQGTEDGEQREDGEGEACGEAGLSLGLGGAALEHRTPGHDDAREPGEAAGTGRSGPERR